MTGIATTRAADVLATLTLEQKAALTAGADYWRTAAFPDAGVPALKMTDGPVGARGDLATPQTSTAFPCGAAVGATWDVELAHLFGVALAQETQTKGAHVLLGPTVNIARHPFAGRNFECMSEDPELTGRLAAAVIRGLQDTGVAASIKHFVANDQETDRMTISSEVAERTLREIYLRPFEAAVAEADPWTVMAAYNKVNGTFASEHPTLLRAILKDEWGWSGVVISDWYATHSAAPAVHAGLDIEMPGPGRFLGPGIADAVRSGDLDEADLDDAVLRILTLLERTGRFIDPQLPAERSEATEERTALAHRIAVDATVLLTNNGLLPLDAAQLHRVAMIGPGADPGFFLGGGSALVWPHRRLSPVDAFRSALPDADVEWIRGTGIGRLATPIHPDLLDDGAWQISYWDNPDGTGDPVYVEATPDIRYSYYGRKIPGLSDPSSMRIVARTRLTAPTSGTWTFELVCAGTVSVTVDGQEVLRNNADEPLERFFPSDIPEFQAPVAVPAEVPVVIEATLTVSTPGCMPHLYLGAMAPDPMAEIADAAARAAEADTAIVFVGTGPEFESESFDRETLSLPGLQDDLVRAVLAAQPRTIVVVSAGAAVDLPWRHEVPALVLNWFGGQEAAPALVDVVLGSAEPGGRLPVSFPQRIEDLPSSGHFPGSAGQVHYAEGLHVGYRGLQASAAVPAFAFGSGGSYTTITLADATARVGADEVLVEVTATNTGDRCGSEVVQVYTLGAIDDAAPVIQLTGFTKVFLAAGEQVRAQIRIPLRALAFWDVPSSSWRVPAGSRTLAVGRSAVAHDLMVTVDLAERSLPTPQA